MQVKATDTAGGNNRISLSNLKRLATAPIPAFYVFINFDRKETPIEAHVVHFDDELISKVLKRIHKINSKAQGDKLHKKKMSINYNSLHKMAELNGRSLKKILKGYIGDDLSSYIEGKKKTLESVGFEKGHGEVKFKIVGEENFQQLMNATLGVPSSIDVVSPSHTKERFGISIEEESSSKSGKIEVLNVAPTTFGLLRFKESKLSSGISFSAEIYVSALNRHLKDEEKKIRIKTEYFDFIMSPILETNVDIRFFPKRNDNQRYDVRKLKDAFRVFSDFNAKYIEIEVDGNIAQYPLSEFTINAHVCQELITLEAAVKVIDYLHINEEINISLNEMFVYGKSICTMREVLESKSIRIEFESNESKIDEAEEIMCVFLLGTLIGNHMIGVLFSAIGIATLNEERKYCFSSSKNTVEKVLIKKPKGIEDFESEIDEIEKKYEDEYLVVRVNFAKLKP